MGIGKAPVGTCIDGPERGIEGGTMAQTTTRTWCFTICLHNEEMASIGKKLLLRDFNPHLICPLCRGYLIDATTVVECLHSFCRSCILKYLNTAAHCPSCKHAINKAKPNIKADKTLQEIVYKLVPGLYHREMLKRKEFYKKHPEHANSATPEQRGEGVSGCLMFNPEDVVSLSLEYLPPGADPLVILNVNDMDTNNSSNVHSNNTNNNNNNYNIANRRYLQCPALVTVAHLKKFIAMKYSVDITRYTIEIHHRRATLPEHWTLMDVAYIYAWKRIAPMRFFYRVAQEEQRLEAPLHQRPSTPGLGARDCLPSTETQNDSNLENNPVSHPATSRSEIKSVRTNVEIALAKDLNKVANNDTSLPMDRKQMMTVEKNEANKMVTTVSTTSSTLTNATKMSTTTTVTNASPSSRMNTSSSTGMNVSPSSNAFSLLGTNTYASGMNASGVNASPSSEMNTSLSGMNMSPSTACNDSNKQIKSPIKILKNSDGRYEVLKNTSTVSITDAKNPTNSEFSVVNSNGVKITLKQCSPPQSSSAKKPKIISNVLLRCGQMEKDVSSPSNALIQQLQRDKEKFSVTKSILPNKQEKQRRKVTFVDRSLISEKTPPATGVTIPKTALKKPAEQQDKKQFLQSFQLTAREPSMLDDNKLKSPVRDISVAMNTAKSLSKNNAMPKMEEFSKKDTDEVKKKSNIENTGSNANGSTLAKRIAEVSANARTYTNKIDDTTDGRLSNSRTGPNSMNIASGNHIGKMDVYAFSSDPSIVPAGAVKRKCPPGVPITDLKRRKTPQTAQRQETNKRQNVSLYNPVVKLTRTFSMEHVVSTSRASIVGNHDSGSSHVSNMNNVNNLNKVSTGSLISNDTRDLLVDGYGLNIPASLSITLTSPKSPGSSGQFIESNDPNDNIRKAALGKVNPSITLNDCSVDPRVLKALKTGQIRMSTPPKSKSMATAATKQTITSVASDRGEAANQRAATSKRKKEHESSKEILDLSGGNKKTDIHPLRIPQPVTKLNKTNKITTGRDNMQSGNISEQGQVVTLVSGHKYYRAPPGCLTPAAHRVNDYSIPSSPSRTPVYAPSFSNINRSNSDISSVFPTLSTFFGLNQAPNLQHFQMDAARHRLPPRSVAESGTSAIGNSDNVNHNISCISGKSHLAAQCTPIKPARSSVAPLAVPINKQQPIEKSMNISVNRTSPADTNKLPTFRNNEALESTDETCHVQRRYSLNIENMNNRFLSRNECAKNNNQVTNETTKESGIEFRNNSNITDNSVQQQWEQQHREVTSPNIVSSTASPPPSPPPNNDVNARNDAKNSGTNISSNDSNENTHTTSGQTKSVSFEMMCNKSPDSPDSSSIIVESNSEMNKNSTDRKMPTDSQTSSNTAKSSELIVNLNDSTVDDSSITGDKNNFSNKSEINEIAKHFNSVQKKLLAVFPSTEWANNPIAAEHLGNFLKSLNVTIENEEFIEKSKVEKVDQKAISNDDNKNR
ncbi:uncharacterized protein LOC105430144 [Pogonomyrmex barbatus]|uniref:Uncharacterized protein LOC105430144 n=1 Tax=Pogonomyrmex barbatus TaxID=144034 RepID=A0A8N1S7T2_9HYME|nr:uncharacterized protein LOC105430144 [Pogonomyrmex barbatus]